MIISVINHTNGDVSDEELHRAVRAINRQIRDDFCPYWSLGATLRIEGRSEDSPDPDQDALADMRGDAVLYVWNGHDIDGALGYHAANHRGIPFGFVFTELAAEIGEPWSVTLSHEALELIADPEVNLLVQGPHPSDPDNLVFHWYEMCDAVQAETYEVDGVAVSNFVLPLYFTGSDELGGRNDFLGRAHGGSTLASFSINPGGYIGFFNPESGQHETVSLAHDAEAARRLEIKSRYKGARRSVRYAGVRDVQAPPARIARAMRVRAPLGRGANGITVLRSMSRGEHGSFSTAARAEPASLRTSSRVPTGPRRRGAMSANPDFPSMKAAVASALAKKHIEPLVEALDAIGTVGAGYLEMQSGSFGPLFPALPHDKVAGKLAEYFDGGEDPHPPTKRTQRPIFRGIVDGLVGDMDFPAPGEIVRETLTSLSLGAWDENAEKALKAWIAGYIVSLYAVGLD